MRSLISSAVVVLVTISILIFLGRMPWCACHGLFLWTSDVWSQHTSQHLIDPYSFSHVQHGMIFFAVLYLIKKPKLYLALIIEGLWEIIENTPLIIDRYRTVTASLGYQGDSIGNSFGDLLSAALGFYLVSKLPAKISVAIYIVIELGMLITIRDSLTLNVLMLIAPLESIKEWQLGTT